jgi:hypothetical protein
MLLITDEYVEWCALIEDSAHFAYDGARVSRH